MISGAFAQNLRLEAPYKDPKPSAVEQSEPAATDAAGIRALYRYQPEFADNLERSLKSATPNERIDLLSKIQVTLLPAKEEHIQREKWMFHDGYFLEEALQQARRDIRNKYLPWNILNAMLSHKVDDSEYALQQAEDKIINAVNSTHKELYDCFRLSYGDNWIERKGLDWADKILRLKETDLDEYARQMEQLLDLLKAYRAVQESKKQAGSEPQPDKSIMEEMSPNPGSVPSPCAQMCGIQPTPGARAWCWAHCRDSGGKVLQWR